MHNNKSSRYLTKVMGYKAKAISSQLLLVQHYHILHATADFRCKTKLNAFLSKMFFIIPQYSVYDTLIAKHAMRN